MLKETTDQPLAIHTHLRGCLVIMESVDRLLDADYLEAQLLADPVAQAEYEESVGGGKILHRATFADLEKNFLNYETVQWILISLLLILAWGVGVILLLYTPIRRYVMRQDFRSRKLYVTSDAIVYKVTRPVFLPWLGVSKMEKCIFLPLITDIVLEQGCLQSLFGLHSIRIETLGQGRPLADYNIHICGVTNPKQFRKVVLSAVTAAGHDGSLSTNSPYQEGTMILGLPRLHSEGGIHSQSFTSPRGRTETPRQMSSSYHGNGLDSYFSISGQQILKKLEDVKNYVKKIETLIERQQGQVSETLSDV